MDSNFHTELSDNSSCRRARQKSLVTSQVTSRYTNLVEDTDTSGFIADAKCLSSIAGCDPSTVVKKMPSPTPELVHAATAADFLYAERVCTLSDLVFHGDAQAYCDDPLDCESLVTWFDPENIAQTDTTLLSPGGKEIIDIAVDMLNRIIDRPFDISDAMILGPGVSQCSTFRSKHILDKLDHNPFYQPNPDFWAADYFECDLASHIMERVEPFKYTVDLIQQVPKKADRNRTIGITDVIALSAQGVVGDYITKCLSHHGLNLRHLQDRHRDLACIGSLQGGLATLDFSMASDTISMGLVWMLLNNNRSTSLCRRLYRLLWGCRTWFYSMDGSDGVYQKFCPMGNRFTFPLESLLFTVLTRAICARLHLSDPNGRKASSFGDDVILYGPDTLLLIYKPVIVNNFYELGLIVNPEKSYFTGDFRESCGADYRQGVFVRGFYHKKLTVTIQDVVRLINHFTVFYNLTLTTILHHCPFIANVFWKCGLDRICYCKLAFIDQLASTSIHSFAAIDTFIVCSEMDMRELGLKGTCLLSYSSPSILAYTLEYHYVKGKKTQYRRYTFDGKRERLTRRKLLARLSSVGEPDLIYNYIGTGQRDNSRPRKLSDLIDNELGVKTPIAWLVPETISTKVRMRDYNPAWPLELPIREVNWF